MEEKAALPKDLLYTDSHEWVRVEGNLLYIGITDHAQSELGDIVYAEIPDKDKEVEKGDEVTTIESVKAAAPIYAPVDGTVKDGNPIKVWLEVTVNFKLK